MRKENASFITKFISEAGSYLINSDYFAFVELKDYACYVIADGIDTDERKESAKLAVTTVITQFSENPGMTKRKLKKYMRAAHQALLMEAAEIRLEASIVILLTDYKKIIWAHAGNSRLYWMKNGNIRIATKDTSLTQKMVDDEELPIDQLAYHEERNNLYTYLGQPGRFTPIISGKKKLEDGDILILMTRGVWENVGEAEIIDAIEGVSKAEDVCTGLEDVILSQRLSVVENYTIATIFVDKIYNNPAAGKYKKWIKIGVSVFTVLFALLISLIVARIQKNKSSIEKIDKYKERGIEYLQENNYTSADEQFSEAYSASEEVNAGTNSKTKTMILCIETYEKLGETLSRASSALQENEYKKASGLFQSALELSVKLQTEYGENVTLFQDGIEAYTTFAANMQIGMEALDIDDYETAINNFIASGEIMDEIDDTTNRNTANNLAKETNAKKAIADGIQFEEKGTQLLNDGMYSQALTQYQSAREMYELAKDEYGDTDAVNKLSLIDIKISNVESMLEKLTNQDLEKEADGYLNLASEAARNGDYDQAVEYYESAKEIFQQTGNTEQIIAINDKIDNAQYGTDEEKAVTSVIDAMDALAGGDVNSAIIFLQQAKEAYNNLNNTSSANKIQSIITKLSTQGE